MVLKIAYALLEPSLPLRRPPSIQDGAQFCERTYSIFRKGLELGLIQLPIAPLSAPMGVGTDAALARCVERQ